MNPFEYVRAESLEKVPTLLGADARPLGGGTDVTELMKQGLMEPSRLVSLKSISGLSYIVEDADGLRIGPTTTLRQIAENEIIRNRYTALAQAALAVASPQIRNAGTLAGNLCQRVRCWYYRAPVAARCYKRGGDYCYAVFGDSSMHAIFDGAACFAVHPSDTAIALSALDARVVTLGPKGRRVLPIAEFFAGPEVDITRENVLGPEEIVAEVQVPASVAGLRSVFLKAANRRSIDFALASVAVVVGGALVVQQAAIALGAVAPTPRRAKRAEEVLLGKGLQDDVINQAADLAVEGARPLGHNAYKVALARGLVYQALARLATA